MPRCNTTFFPEILWDTLSTTVHKIARLARCRLDEGVLLRAEKSSYFSIRSAEEVLSIRGLISSDRRQTAGLPVGKRSHHSKYRVGCY